MSKSKSYNYCDAYKPMSTEKLMKAMGNSYLFNYSCDNCDNCVQCGKCRKNTATH